MWLLLLFLFLLFYYCCCYDCAARSSVAFELRCSTKLAAGCCPASWTRLRPRPTTNQPPIDCVCECEHVNVNVNFGLCQCPPHPFWPHTHTHSLTLTRMPRYLRSRLTGGRSAGSEGGVTSFAKKTAAIVLSTGEIRPKSRANKLCNFLAFVRNGVKFD